MSSSYETGALLNEPLYENPPLDRIEVPLQFSRWLDMVLHRAFVPDNEAPEDAWQSFARVVTPAVTIDSCVVAESVTINALPVASFPYVVSWHPGPEFVEP